MRRGGRPGIPLKPEYAALGDWIRLRREQAGLGQKALSRELGHHEQWLHRIEKGTQRIDVVDFFALLKTLGDIDCAELSELERRLGDAS